jgi:phosphinothricin acetyltransferase
VTAVIRLATAHDALGIQAIYAPIVRDTAISFDVEPPTVEEMRQRIISTLAYWPWLVCDRDGDILGYVYASQHRTRQAYQWSVDVSVYVHAAARRSGVGRGLYRSLFALLTLQGFYQAYAGITLPNPASVGLHERWRLRPPLEPSTPPARAGARLAGLEPGLSPAMAATTILLRGCSC